MISGSHAGVNALEIGAAVGFDICRDALWGHERCTWLEPVPVALSRNPAVSATCSANVYGGTAGIGWFLAQAAAQTAEPLLLRTARAALRQTSAQAQTTLKIAPHGFFSGAAGTGAALILAGKSINDDQAVADGLSLLMSIPTDTDDPFAMDLVSGLAGTVLSMTVASAVLDQDHELLARAGTAAEFLVSCGERGPDGSLSWKTMRDCSSNLTGFAHGTSGIAHALLALAATAREGDFRKAAADAIAYESSVFDPVRRLWPDFRSLPEYFEGESAFGVGWCHGAAGIVRGRITAAASNIKVDSDLDAGITAIVEQARRWSQFPSVDLTLCHGLLGLVDTLLECSRFNYGNYDELVAEVVAPIVDQFHDGLPWPTGLPSREPAHGLMLGDAGIGHFFLRLTDPTQESVLAPGLSLVTK